MKKIDKKKQGKRNLEKGRRFETKVRADLESKKWVVDRWTNNVDLEKGKIIPARQGKFRKTSTGLPDFIVFKTILHACIWGVECKSNGYLTKEEKMKFDWYLKNGVFSRILIAKKGKKRGKIEYKEYGNV